MAIDKTIKLKVDSKDAVKGLDQVDKSVKGVDKSAKGAKSGLGGMTSAAKGLGTAFKALGIGLIVAAFVKLKDIFSGNIETARMFERVTSQLSAAFDVIRDRAEDFIKQLIKLKNPLKAFREAFTGTTAEIKEETKAMGELTRQLQIVRDEERSMVLERANANKIIAESRLLAEDETKTMEERLIALKAAVAEEQRVAKLELETQSKKVEALQAVIDLGKSSEEDLIELENERAKLIDLQTASVLKQKRVVTEIVTFEKQIETERQKNAANQTKRTEAETRAKELGLEFDNELTTAEINNLIKIEEKRQELADKKEETDIANFEKGLEDFTNRELTKEELEIQTATDKYNKLLEIAEQYNLDTVALTSGYQKQIKGIQDKFDKEELKTQQAQIKAKQAATIDAGKAILSGIGQLAGEGTKVGKAAAVAQILIDTASGISSAIAGASAAGAASGPAAPITTPLLIAQLVGQVLAGIGQAKAVLGKVKDGGGGGELSGIDSVAPSTGGTVSVPDVEPEEDSPTGLGPLVPNIEAITTATQPIQAFVVENDISSSQALQEELEVQATL